MMWILVLGFLLVLAPAIWTYLRKDDGFAMPKAELHQVNGLEYAVYRQGQGPQILLLHGLGASSFCWRYLFPSLAKDHEVVAIDLIGFGSSSKPHDATYVLEEQGQWLRQIVDHLDIRPSLVVGSSMGGLLALWLARHAPERAPRVLVLSPATIGPHLSRHFHVGTAPFVRLGIGSIFMPWAVWFVVGSLKPMNRRSMKEYQRPFFTPGSRRAGYRAGLALFDHRLPDLLTGISAPVLILRGNRDWLVGRRTMQKLVKVLPHAEYREILSGHHPQEHIPDLLEKEIRDWLKAGKPDKN